MFRGDSVKFAYVRKTHASKYEIVLADRVIMTLAEFVSLLTFIEDMLMVTTDYVLYCFDVRDGTTSSLSSSSLSRGRFCSHIMFYNRGIMKWDWIKQEARKQCQ